ncbi:hypothetical protein F5887DRAFT_916509 [Amanita rubescens]|nr:hypothetical protein F5887DRAFT_916509 [Amanita rubescens]
MADMWQAIQKLQDGLSKLQDGLSKLQNDLAGERADRLVVQEKHENAIAKLEKKLKGGSKRDDAIKDLEASVKQLERQLEKRQELEEKLDHNKKFIKQLQRQLAPIQRRVLLDYGRLDILRYFKDEANTWDDLVQQHPRSVDLVNAIMDKLKGNKDLKFHPSRQAIRYLCLPNDYLPYLIGFQPEVAAIQVSIISNVTHYMAECHGQELIGKVRHKVKSIKSKQTRIYDIHRPPSGSRMVLRDLQPQALQTPPKRNIPLTGMSFLTGAMCLQKIFSTMTGRRSQALGRHISNVVQGERQLRDFLGCVVPETSAHDVTTPPELQHIQTWDDFIADVMEGIRAAPMSSRPTPHIFSLVDWSRVLMDPLRNQFIPLKSSLKPDRPKLSLHEMQDSPVPGLVHRYPTKALFLGSLAISLRLQDFSDYTRSYGVGARTVTISKAPSPPARRRWEKVFRYIEDTPALNDIVVSVPVIGTRLLSTPHNHEWMDALTKIANDARSMGKTTALHTHFNHPQEITWVTEVAARKLFEQGITVRNQTVLLKGVNDELDTMKMLIWKLANNNIQRKSRRQKNRRVGKEDAEEGGNGANRRAPKRVEEETLNEMTIIATILFKVRQNRTKTAPPHLRASDKLTEAKSASSRKESNASFANDLETAGSKHKNRVGNNAVLISAEGDKHKIAPILRDRAARCISGEDLPPSKLPVEDKLNPEDDFAFNSRWKWIISKQE